MRTMKPLALFILILCTIQPNNANDLIRKACIQTPFYTDCIRYLKSYPNIDNSNLNEFVVLMFNIMKIEATATSTKIDKLLAGKSIPRASRAYDSLVLCAKLYEEIATSDAVRPMESLIRGDPDIAIVAGKDVAGKATQCENNFGGRGSEKTPITVENNDMNHIGVIATGIAELLRYE
ncbi:unnamed protein product [Lathyrus oleraceus]